MNIDPFLLWSALAFFALVGCSAFFSSAETAFFSLTRSQVAELDERTDAAARRVIKLLGNPRRLLIVLLTGNMTVNIIAASVVALTTQRLLGGVEWSPWGVFAVQVVLVTLVILVFGEVLPKLAAIRNPVASSLKLSTPTLFVDRLFTPLVIVLLPITEFTARTLGVEKRRLWISEDEIKTLVEVGEEHGALETSEKELIHSIFEFGDTTVREIMVPRTDMVCIDVETSINEVLKVIRDNGHSRIPVYEGNIDNIVGILYAKDLLMHYPFTEEFNLRSILRTPFFVPEAKLIHELLKQFQDQRVHMTIAVDEYGGTAGMVTFEDVIEEIVGEIQDEHDEEHALWTRLDADTVIADARLDVETVNQVLDGDVLPTDQDFETLGGFLLAELGDFPKVKTVVNYHNYSFVVEEVNAHRVGKVRIIRRETDEATRDETNG